MRLWRSMALGMLVCGNLAAAPMQNSIQAVVNDSIITTLALDNEVRDAVDLLRRTYYNQPQVLAQKVDQTYDEALQNLIARELILDEFASSGGVIPETIVEEEVQRRIRVGFGGDRVTFIKELQGRGLTAEIFRKQVQEDMILQYMHQRNITSVTIVSPAKIEAYYQQNLQRYQLGDQAKLRVIVFNPSSGVRLEELLPLARDVAAKIRSGDASFAEMAAVHSDGSQRQRSGDWGWLERTQLKRGLADIAFDLEAGQPSSVIGLSTDLNGDYWIYLYDDAGTLIRARQYSAGDEPIATKESADLGDPPTAPLPPDEFYLMLVEERRSARVKSLAEQRDEIERELSFQERERLRQRWISRLREKAFVRYF